MGKREKKARMRLPIAGASEGDKTQDEGPPDIIVPIRKGVSDDLSKPKKKRGICVRIRGLLARNKES